MQQIAEELNLVNFDISKKLLTDEDRIIWENMGLTSDIQSMENAAILTKVGSAIFCVQYFINFLPHYTDSEPSFRISTHSVVKRSNERRHFLATKLP